jgi:hypothetical protein
VKLSNRIAWSGHVSDCGATHFRLVLQLPRGRMVVERDGADAMGVSRWEELPPASELWQRAVAAAFVEMLAHCDKCSDELYDLQAELEAERLNGKQAK